MLNKDLIVIDDFYDNPFGMRNLALQSEYLAFLNSNIPGYESKNSYFNNYYAEKFSKLINNKIDINPNKLSYGKFRYSLAESKSLSSMHLDKAEWSAIVYLTLDMDCKGGLGVYKHKETGLSKVPDNFEELNKIGYSSIADLDRKIVHPATNMFDKWELIEHIPMKFNRLVLLRGSKYFHSVTEKFGESIVNGRLSHNFFFNEAETD